MPRRPTRIRQSVIARPVTFSPFARSIAQLANAYMIKRQVHHTKPPVSPPRTGNHNMKHNLEVYSEQSESSEEKDVESSEEEGTVQADFAFFDPKPDDFHGVKILLQNYLDNKQWDLSGFTDLILGQTTVGTVVKMEDDEDGLFSVVTALNLGRHKDHKCIKEVKEFLLSVCHENTVVDDLRLLLGKKADNVGLLVSQRVVNLPYQLLPPLYDALFDEVSWATEDEPTEELRNSFCFRSYLLISKIYKHKNAEKENWQASHSDEAIIYIKPEDELFHKLCSWSFSFPLQTEQATTHELRNYRLMGLVMSVEADKISSFREQLHSLMDDN